LIRARRGTVTKVLRRRAGLTEVAVVVEGRTERAINYDSLTGQVEAGDLVALNTTAVAKNLGTGGHHFVMWVEGKAAPDPAEAGHIMKMRYTPFQVKVLAVEEADHPGNSLYRSAKGLEGTPVMVGTLHSMTAPAAAALKHTAGRDIKLVYMMTDGAALPIWFSILVNDLRTKSLIDSAVTCGHAFGGDFEAINVYSGLLWARAAGADAIVVSMGPGIVGSSSEFGHTALEQGEIINAVNILGGRAVAIPRISFADARDRHFGLSHHTRTALGKVALTPCTVPVPILEGDKKHLVHCQMRESGIYDRHLVVQVDTCKLPAILEFYGLEVTTMGRSVKDDPEFFHAAGAAGFYTAGLLQAGVNKAHDSSVYWRLPAQHTDQAGYPADINKSIPGAV
jgi:hypothetical protein